MCYQYLDSRRFAGSFAWLRMVANRFIRLVPAYLALLLLIQPLSYFLCSGPFCGVSPAEECSTYWWRNILFIQNLYPMSEMCAPWTFYLAVDFQLCLLCIFILTVSYHTPPLKLVMLVGFLLGSWISTLFVVNQYSITTDVIAMYTSGGTFLDLYLDKPYVQAGPYFIGIATGLLIHRSSATEPTRLGRWAQWAGWTISTFVSMALVFGMYKVELTGTLAWAYLCLGKTAWALCLAWVSWCCWLGKGGLVNWFLSLPAMKPLSRLSFCVYLIHPVIINTFISNQEVALHGSALTLAGLSGMFLTASYSAAFVFSVVFEAPWRNVHRLYKAS